MATAGNDHEGGGGPPPVVVPDDASALEPDRLAWIAEQRALRPGRRRRGWRRLLLTRRWDRYGLSGPIVTLCLLVTALVGGLAVAFVPRPRLPVPAAAPLAAAPQVRVRPAAQNPPAVEPPAGGVLGHRLPPLALEGDARPLAAPDLRPAVIVLVPPDCACSNLLRTVYRQARQFRLTVWLVGAPRPGEAGTTATRNRLVRLDEAGTDGGARWAVDATGALWSALAGRGTTLVAVRSDGTVAALRRDLPLDGADLPALEPLLARLIIANR